MTEHRTHSVDRRRFLAAAAGGAVALATPGFRGRQAMAAARPWSMRLSCSSINFMKLPIEQACQQMAALGFEAIDIWSAHAGCPHLDDVQDRLGPEGLKELLAKHHLKLYAFSVYTGGYAKYAELLGKVGGGMAVRGSGRKCDPKELQPCMKAFFEGLKPEIELAEKHNSYLAIENHGNSLLDSLDSYKAFVDLNRHPRVGLALAPYHLQGSKASVEEAIAVAGKQLFFFYAWQRGEGLEQMPDHGPADFVPWLAALAKIDYAWYVNPFMHHEPEPQTMAAAHKKACQYLRKCCTKVAGG
jgi:sugar phosphate isomerase/epimerase